MNINLAFQQFIISKELQELSRKSISDYQQFIKPFLEYLGENARVSELSQERITKYQMMIHHKSISKATKATYLRNVKIFLAWLQKKYGGDYDISEIKLPRARKKNIHLYEKEEIELLFNSIHTESDWMTWRNKAIIALMLDSGLRQGEISSLRRENVSLSSNVMTVHGKGDKERVVPLGKFSKYMLGKFFNECPFSSEYVFCDRLGNQITTNAVKKFVYKLSEELPFSISSHKLRHNFATNFCLDQLHRNGQADVYQLKCIMGHESIETTNGYLHVAQEIFASENCISHLDMVYGVEN